MDGCLLEPPQSSFGRYAATLAATRHVVGGFAATRPGTVTYTGRYAAICLTKLASQGKNLRPAVAEVQPEAGEVKAGGGYEPGLQDGGWGGGESSCVLCVCV